MIVRTLPDLGALLLAAVLLMGPQVPAQASSPAPAPSASLTTAPQVQEWISRQGQDMIRQEIAQDASAGSPVNVETWSDGVLDATDLDNPTDPTTTWVAVVSTADGPVGVLVVEAGGSEPSGMVQQDAELAANLAALPDRAIVLREPAPPSAAAAGSATASSAPSPQPSPESTTDPAAAAGDDADEGADTYADIADPAASDAWYALTDDVVTALDEQAAAGLAGPAGLSAYAQVLRDRSHGIVDTDKTDTRKSSHTLDLAIVYTGIGVLAIGAFIVTTTFVHERRVMAPLRESPESKTAGDSDPVP
ncbi:MAG: hypothetical protein DI576_05945 [Actinomyces sp.]|nr:MAG: hypothetical protein DI576_05945 [Actinomyces sp.]